MFSYVLAIYCIIFLMIYTTAIHKTDLLSNSSSLFKNNIINSKHCYFDDNTLLKDQTKLSKNNQLNCIHLQVTKCINQVLKDKRVDGRLMNDDNIFFKRKLLLEKTNIYNENKKKIMKNINKNKIKEMKNIENNKQFKVTKSRKHLKKYSKNDKSEEYKKKIRLLRQKSALIEINREEEEMKSSKMILLSSEIKRIHSIELLNKRKQRKVFNKTLKKYLKRQKNVKNDRLKKNFSKIKKRYTLLWRSRRPYSQKKFSRLTLRGNKLYKRTFTKKSRYTLRYRKSRLPFSVRAHTRRKVSHHYTKMPYTKRTGTYASRSTYQRRLFNKYKKRFSLKRGTYRIKYKFQIITRKGFTKVKYQKKKMVYSRRRYRSMKPYTRIYYSRWRSNKIKGNIKKKRSKMFNTNRKKNYTFSRRTIQNKSRRKVTKTSYTKKFFSRLSGYTKIRKSGTNKMQKINRKKTNYINKKIITYKNRDVKMKKYNRSLKCNVLRTIKRKLKTNRNHTRVKLKYTKMIKRRTGLTYSTKRKKNKFFTKRKGTYKKRSVKKIKTRKYRCTRIKKIGIQSDNQIRITNFTKGTYKLYSRKKNSITVTRRKPTGIKRITGYTKRKSKITRKNTFKVDFKVKKYFTVNKLL